MAATIGPLLIKVAQLAVKRALLVYFVKLTGALFGHLGKFHSHDAEARGVDHLEDVADVARAHGVGFDHGKCSVA
jgi:hypothetical protein